VTGEFYHAPVLAREAIASLNIRPDGIYVDGTLGGGNHSEMILERLTSGRLIGIDRDTTALDAASLKLKRFGSHFTPMQGNFADTHIILGKLGIKLADGMLFDLGISSPQVDDASRGFSYMTDAPLDMRMDRSSGRTAAELIYELSETELKRILYEYGEERYAPRIAAAIVTARTAKPITTTLELAAIIKNSMPGAALREKQHPAKRSFQALRIAVNDELSAIENMLQNAPDCLRSGGRIAVISFHSLEDRLVKNAFRKRDKGCVCPPDFPECRCGFVRSLKVITQKPITASPEELERNPRSRSAKLRVAEKI